MQKAEGGIINKAEAGQLKELERSEQASTCPTCGGPTEFKGAVNTEEVGGSHGLKARLTGTDFPGYHIRQMKRGEKISGD